MKRTPWRAIAEALEREGVEYVFGLPGNPAHLLEDLEDHTDIKFVLMRDEPSAVYAAYAYARQTGEPAVCFSNPGPGITNLVTGLLEATSGSLPVIALCNGVVENHNGMGAFQELDAQALMRPVTKWATRITDTTTTSWVIQRAFSVSQNGRPGAVFVELPTDIALNTAEIPDYTPSRGRHRMRSSTEALGDAADLIRAAQRPAILCGSGAYWSGASEQVRRLAHLCGIPMFTTPGGRGTVAETDELFYGLTGLYFTELGKRRFLDSDLVISVGSRLEAFSTGSWTLLPENARYLQIDIDPDTIGMNWQPDVALVGDARLVLDDLADALEPMADADGVSERIRKLAEERSTYIDSVREDAFEMHEPIRPRHVVAAANKVFGDDTILMKENGGSDLWCYYWPYYMVRQTGDCVPMAEQTAMGAGIIGCIGAKLARPDKQVICISGDAAMFMGMKELATAAEWNLGVTWVVLNNHAIGWVQYNQLLKNRSYFGTGFKQDTDLVAIAHAQGCDAWKVTDPNDLESTLEKARVANSQGRPALVDVEIAAHDYYQHFVEVHRRKIGE